MTIHADPEILGRRLTSHPPAAPGDDGLSITTEPGDITCDWCRHALGINDINPKGDKAEGEKEAEVRSFTVAYAHDGIVEKLTADADRIEVHEEGNFLALLRADQLVVGVPMGRVVFWVAANAELDKETTAS